MKNNRTFTNNKKWKKRRKPNIVKTNINEIYYVSAISLHKYTEEDLKNKYEIHKIKYNKDISYEQFLKFIKSWRDDKYDISDFISSYHLSQKEAIEYIEKNIGDICECGSYPYACVSKASVGYAYFDSKNSRDNYLIYKYDTKLNRYIKLDKKAEEYPYLIEHVWGYIQGNNTEEE